MNLLILENDSALPDLLTRALRNISRDNEKVITYLERVNNKNLLSDLLWCDIICFQPTFTNFSQNKSLIEIFSKLPPKDIYILHYELKETLERYFEVEELYSVKHHNIFELSSYSEFQEGKIVFDFTEHENELEKIRQLKESEFNSFTGREVEILDIVAFNQEFKNLKKGDIVKELKRPKYDPNPSRGIWVKGVTEPVKLLDERYAHEYKIIYK